MWSHATIDCSFSDLTGLVPNTRKNAAADTNSIRKEKHSSSPRLKQQFADEKLGSQYHI